MPPSADSHTAIMVAATAARDWPDEPDRLGALMRLGVDLRRLGAPLLRPHQTLALLRGEAPEGDPDNVLLPTIASHRFLERDLPTEAAEELATEDEEEFLGQQVIGRIVRTCRGMDDGDRIYREIRRGLIEQPVRTASQWMRLLQPLGRRFPFHEIAVPLGAACIWSNDTDHWAPCPVCRWPMRGDGVHCDCPSIRCRRQSPVAAGTAPPAFQEALTGSESLHALKRSVWRYTVQSGLVELELAAALEAGGAEVVMWPEVDRCDLRVTTPSNSWRVDVKDWSRPQRLVRRLEQQPLAADVVLVIPEDRSNQLTMLRERLSGTRILSGDAFVAEVLGTLQEASDV